MLSQDTYKKGRLIRGALSLFRIILKLVEDITQANLEHPALTDVQVGVVGFGRIGILNLHHRVGRNIVRVPAFIIQDCSIVTDGHVLVNTPI